MGPLLGSTSTIDEEQGHRTRGYKAHMLFAKPYFGAFVRYKYPLVRRPAPNIDLQIGKLIKTPIGGSKIGYLSFRLEIYIGMYLNISIGLPPYIKP